MRKFAIVSGICGSLVLGAALLASAQDEHRDVPPDRQDQARPADRQGMERQNQNQEQPSVNRPAENRQGQDRQTQQQRDMNREQGQTTIERQNQERQNQERQNQRRQEEMHPNDNRQNNREVYQGRQDQARPEGQARRGEHDRNARRIPDNDFRAHFGREHRFAPGRMQVYEGRPQFFYSGYTFELLEPWPSDWSYDEDDCYVDYDDDGYWLYNYRYPGERVPLMLVQ